MRGKLVVFEGGEGSGKTTQLHHVQQWLETSGWLAKLLQVLPDLPRPLLVTREPGGTFLGRQLRQLLLNTTEGESIQPRAELLLFAADRAQHVETLIQPHLAAGGLVLCDRYIDSTIAYQGYGRGLDLELIGQLNQMATGGLTSDLVLWLDLDVEVGLTRSQKRLHQTGQQRLDRIESVDLAFHQRVRQGFVALAQQYPERIVPINASASETAVATQIQTILDQRLSQWYSQPLI